MIEKYWIILTIMTLAYVAIALVLGIQAAKGQMMRKINDWAVASRGLGTFVMFFLTGAGAVSAYTFLGAPGWTYSKGVPVLYVVAYLTLGYFTCYFFLTRLWKVGKKFTFVTQAGVMRHRYDSPLVGGISALIGILGCIGYGITQGMGCGYIISFASGGRIPFWGGVAIVFVVMCIYIIVSGLRAIGWTNVFQGILMLVVAYVGGFLVVRHFWGNTGNLFATLQREAPQFLTLKGGGWNYRVWTTGTLVSALGIICWPTFWIMWMGSKSISVVRKTVSLLPLYFFTILPMLLVGWAAVKALPGIKPTDTIAMQASLQALPVWMTGLMFAATLAAAMSSCEILIMNAGLQFVTDILAPIFKKLSDEKLTRLSRILVTPFAAIIVVVSIFKPESLVGMLLMTYGWLVQLFPTIFGMFYWKRGTKYGAASGLIAGTVVSILFSKTWPNPLGIHAGVWGLAINVLLFVVVSLLTKPPAAKIVNEYFDLDKLSEEDLMKGVKPSKAS